MDVAQARLLDVGNCDPDHAAIRAMLIKHFDVSIDRVMFVDEALAALNRATYDLVLVNRLIFDDGSEGMALVRAMRGDPAQKTPVMLVSNFDDAQHAAVDAGALRGFGKANLGAAATLARLAEILPAKAK
jgi:DNA-binding response OmpR family regulator